MQGFIKWFCVSSGANSIDFMNNLFLKNIKSMKMNRCCITPDMNKHHKNSEIDRFETWHIKKTIMVALSLLFWSIYLCFRYFDRFRTLSCNFHPAFSHFPPSIPLIFLNFPPSINPLLHALKTELFFPPRVCSSTTQLFMRFKKYLCTPKQYSSIQQRILAWTNSSRRARHHVWCWVEFHPHHCLRGAFWRSLSKRNPPISTHLSGEWESPGEMPHVDDTKNSTNGKWVRCPAYRVQWSRSCNIPTITESLYHIFQHLRCVWFMETDSSL